MAKKSLGEMLSENIKRPEVKGYSRRQAVFLAYWEQIEAAYKEGWSYMDIWQALWREGIFDFGYSTFLHYKDKKKRRAFEVERDKARIEAARTEPAGGPVESPTPLPKPPQQPRVPGSTKVDLPVFGQPGVKRDPKRF